VADPNLKWNVASRRTAPRKSWVARTIDRLSKQFDVVFVTCTGNVVTHDVSDYFRGGAEYPEYLCDQDCRILDPGQAALALTVGSIAPGTVVIVSPDVAIAGEHHPSPFTRTGPGIRREVKPELVEHGGNFARSETGDRAVMNAGLNVVMASHQVTPPITNGCGTSFAAPRVAHKLGLTLYRLEGMEINPTSALLKAFLVNSANYRGDTSALIERLDAVEKRHWINVLGYGFPDADRATFCEPNTSILYYQGEIGKNQIAFFDVPIPEVLTTSGLSNKRLTVTVAFSPDVQRWGLESYLGTLMRWRMFRGNVPRDDVIEAMALEEISNDTSNPNDLESEDSKGNDEESPKEIKFEFGVRLRSRGVIQHDVHTWKRHTQDYSSGHYTLAVSAYEKWGRANPGSVPYAVVVRIEDSQGDIPVYAEVSKLLGKITIRT
jgi:hypothetical protein